MAVHSRSVLDGENPLTEHISLFILQLLLIISFSRLLAVGLRHLKQPTVIAEVIGGILLGPTGLSRIPVFKENVFPTDSLPRLKLVADIGLVLYLFLVGMELDPVQITKNFRKAATISLAGIMLPFGMGVGVARLIYDQYIQSDIPFTSFFVFCGVAMSITAFPVLARILTERRLITTPVGQATITAAASDDAAAWCLLLLTVALINNPDRSINALFVFLIVIAFGLFLWIAVRPVFVMLVNRSRRDNGASQTNVFIIFIVMLISAWFTQAIGVHAIFGSFLVGLITPHDRGFAIALTEKMEDLVAVLFLPLYFAYSGLNTNLVELNDAMSWLMVLLVLVVACAGKIIGCTAAARFAKMPWRESIAIGLLMNTKGLIEIIVLNLGLQGGLITEKVFAIFLVMALATTLMTVPLVSIVYPFSVYMHSEYTPSDGDHSPELQTEPSQKTLQSNFSILICLPNMKTTSSMMQFLQMLHSSQRKLEFYCLRLIELGSRMSQVMMASESVNTMNSDPVMSVLRSFANVNQVKLKTLLTVGQETHFHSDVIEASDDLGCHFVVFPIEVHPKKVSGSNNGIPKWAVQCVEKLWIHSHCPVGFFVDRGFGVSKSPFKVPSGLEDVSPSTKKTIFFVMDNNPDSLEAAVVMNFLAYHDCNFVVYTIDEESSPALEALETFPNVTVEHGTFDIKLISRTTKLEKRDLIVIGYKTVNSDLTTTGFKFWLEHVSHTSFMVVKGVAEPPMEKELEEHSLRMRRTHSHRSLIGLTRPDSVL
jgi:Kef-type K+ transport system membrane component KefB